MGHINVNTWPDTVTMRADRTVIEPAGPEDI
jgi:hypothetical protein